MDVVVGDATSPPRSSTSGDGNHVAVFRRAPVLGSQATVEAEHKRLPVTLDIKSPVTLETMSMDKLNMMLFLGANILLLDSACYSCCCY